MQRYRINYSLDYCSFIIHEKFMLKKPALLITEEKIKETVVELGKKITEDYQGQNLLLVVLLRGSVIFASDLIRSIDLNVSIDFMDISSYKGKTSTGNVQILKDLEEDIENRHVLIVEDIVDTGQTLHKVFDLLKNRKPASIEICSFLDKPMKRLKEVDVKYIGIEIEDKFVVGYGLDEDQKYRQLPYVGVFED